MRIKEILKSVFILSSVLILATLATNSYFSDQASVAGNVFSTGTWPPPKIVINEVYYDLAGDKGTEPGDEWLELYNPNDFAVNLQNWTITDNNTTRTIHANKFIAAHGFALISKDHSTWSLYWTVPSGVEIIELGQNIGNGLANDGDRVILKNSLGNIIDQMSYGNDTSILNPACVDVAEGHSLERSPVGKDTDTATDFIYQVNPTPGAGI